MKPSTKDGLSTLRIRYLEAAYDLIRKELIKQAPPREKVALAFSFPSSNARGSANGSKRIGECHYNSEGAQTLPEKFLIAIHPQQWGTPLDVLHVLAHEIAHAATPGAGHNRTFAEVAYAAGLSGKPTATVPGEAFKQWAKQAEKSLPKFPAGAFNLTRRIQGTRLRLFECGCESPVKIRCGRDELNVRCNDCREDFHLVEGSRKPRQEGGVNQTATN